MNHTLSSRFIIGLLITAAAFVGAVLLGHLTSFTTGFVASSFTTHAIMLVLAVALIILFKVNYRINWPSLRRLIKPVVLGFVVALVINIVLGLLTVAFTGHPEGHPAIANASVLQFFVFDFILASVAEEYLFRGFLQNYLAPLDHLGITVMRRRLTLPVIVGAVAFGLAHMVLLASGSSGLFVIRMVIFTAVLGLIAGYYQHKYRNHAYAIAVHMAGNLMGLISIALT